MEKSFGTFPEHTSTACVEWPFSMVASQKKRPKNLETRLDTGWVQTIASGPFH
jgi:hypothetical protein